MFLFIVKIFKISIIKGIGYSNIYESEPWMIALLYEILKNADCTFIDVDVNLGQTLLKVKSIPPAINYIGFEPNSVCIFYCYELVKIYKLQNATILPVAIFNNNSKVNLNLYNHDSSDSSASIIDEFRPH